MDTWIYIFVVFIYETEKEVPQPQLVPAFGFSKWNVSPMISFFQSIFVPSKWKILIHQ